MDARIWHSDADEAVVDGVEDEFEPVGDTQLGVLVRWFLTVASLTPSLSAISLLRRSMETQRTTSISQLERRASRCPANHSRRRCG